MKQTRRGFLARAAVVAVALGLAPAVKAEAAPEVLPTLLPGQRWAIDKPRECCNGICGGQGQGDATTTYTSGTGANLWTVQGVAQPAGTNSGIYIKGDTDWPIRLSVHDSEADVLLRVDQHGAIQDPPHLAGQKWPFTFEAMQQDCEARGCRIGGDGKRYLHTAFKRAKTETGMRLLIESDLARVDAWRRGLHVDSEG